MRIFIRTDAAINIGTGHVIRCLAIADALNKNNTDVKFICREEAGNLIEMILKREYEVFRLPANIDMRLDAELTKKVIEPLTSRTDWLIIDQYDIDISWESLLRPIVGKIMVIDDLANRQHDCDILLDQNYAMDEGRYNNLVPDRCIQLIGPKYALLRPQFLYARRDSSKYNSKAKRILVFISGIDKYNVTCKVLGALHQLNRSDITTDVVIGPTSPFRFEVEKILSAMPNTVMHIDTDNMAELMAAADLSIGAGGTATWERCCVGLPTIVVSIADNQVDIAEALNKNGVIMHLGWHNMVTEEDMKDAVNRLIEDPEKRKTMSVKGMEMVDGNGIERVVQQLFASEESKNSEGIDLILRNFEVGDSNDLFIWRNHPVVRRNSFNTNTLTREEHEKWVNLKSRDTGTTIYVAYHNEDKIGTIRFEERNDVIKVSVMLNPEYMGKDLGGKLIRLGTEKFVNEKKPDRPIVAEIKKDNIASIKAFQKAGFKESHHVYTLDFREVFA